MNPRKSSSNTHPVIPKIINLIWNGGMMRSNHVERVLEWMRVNCDYEIKIWVDSQFKREIRRQFPRNCTVHIFDVKSLQLPKMVREFIDAIEDSSIASTVPNWSAVSDIYRFYILRNTGGWYVDTDIVPVDMSTIHVDPSLQFHFYGSRIDNQVKDLAPCVIGFSKEHIVTTLAIQFIENVCPAFNNPILLEGINSNQGTNRMSMTFWTTGFILRAALGKVLINNKPLINVNGETDNSIPDLNVFDRATSLFENLNEKSWIFSKLEKNEDNTLSVTTLKGITYNKNVNSANQLLHYVSQLRVQAFDQIPAATIPSIANEAVYSEQIILNKDDSTDKNVNIVGDYLSDKTSATQIENNYLLPPPHQESSNTPAPNAVLVSTALLFYCLSNFLPWNRERQLTESDSKLLSEYSNKLDGFKTILKERKENTLYKNGTTDQLYIDIFYAYKKAFEIVQEMKKIKKTTSSIMSQLQHKIEYIELELSNVLGAEEKITGILQNNKQLSTDISFFINNKKYKATPHIETMQPPSVSK